MVWVFDIGCHFEATPPVEPFDDGRSIPVMDRAVDTILCNILHFCGRLRCQTWLCCNVSMFSIVPSVEVQESIIYETLKS